MKKVLLLLLLLSTPAFGQEVVSGREQLAWDWDGDPTATFDYYVDGEFAQAAGATCTEGVCRASFPPLTPGIHEITVVGHVVVDGIELLSPFSPPLALRFVAVPAPGQPRVERIPSA